MTSSELMEALTEHAKTLGWEIEEWSWTDLDGNDGKSETFPPWLRPLSIAENGADNA